MLAYQEEALVAINDFFLHKLKIQPVVTTSGNYVKNKKKRLSTYIIH